MEQKVICPSCGISNSPEQQFCGECGAKLPAPATQGELVCPSCGSASPITRQFCGNCGAKLPGTVAQQQIVCPNCGFQNMPDQQFCGSCGARLVTPKPEAVAKAAVPVAPAKPETAIKAAAPAPITVTPEASAKPVMASQSPEKTEKAAVVRGPTIKQGQVLVKPTMGLAWGLFWRMLILTVLIGLIVYLIVFGVMLAMGGQVPGFPF